MTRIYSKLLAGLVILFGLMAIASPIVGRFRIVNPVIDGIFEGCADQPQPCWYGIRPGNTTTADALSKIQQTAFYSLNQHGHIVVVVYRNANMRCGVELRSEADVIDTVTILNCFDSQIGDVVKAMRNVNHKLPYSVGMLDAVSYDDASGSAHESPCLNYTHYSQIIGMPLGRTGEAIPVKPANWHDFLPYGWYVHIGGTISCDDMNVG